MRTTLFVPLLLGLLSFTALPQTTECPVSFDREGRIMAVTPRLAARLGLSPPAWPVGGDFVEARLFASDRDGYVLVVTSPNGVVTRYLLTAQARDDLADAIAARTAAGGRLTVVERPDLIAEPAKGQFVRNQTIGAALIYGPSLAALASDGTGAAALYWASVGTTFFATAGFVKDHTVSKAQNHIATDGIWRGALIGAGTLHLFDADPDDKAVAAATLCGGLAGTVAGYRGGRRLTVSEAHAATFGSTFCAATTAGMIAATGGFAGDDSRLELGGLIGASLLGYPVGLRYARNARYSVTAGDVGILGSTSIIGAIAGSWFIVGQGARDETNAQVITAGYLAGTLIGDRLLVRRYDFTESEAWLMRLGALAGSLIAMTIPMASHTGDDRAYVGFGTAGAIAGLLLTHRLIEPRPDPQRTR